MPITAGIRVVLFDAGGVLVQLTGVETLRAWLGPRVTPEELWQLWLQSSCVRAFETGQIEPDEFAERIVAELGVPVSPSQFLTAFSTWSAGIYPGALALLEQIPRHYRRAVLSNTNAVHWPRTQRELAGHAFDAHFASHLTGRIKPDQDAFQHVIDEFSCEASQVLFLDDNRLNVDAAAALGMHARVVRGVQETAQVLEEVGVVGPASSVASP